MNKKPAHHINHHPVEKVFKILGAVVITGILVYQLLFYFFLQIAYIPTLQHLLATLVVLGVLLYSYFLVLTIKSRGKIVVVLVLFVTTILMSAVLLYVFTPLLDFVAAQVVNSMLCSRVPELKNLSSLVGNMQTLCKEMSTKFLFGY